MAFFFVLDTTLDDRKKDFICYLDTGEKHERLRKDGYMCIIVLIERTDSPLYLTIGFGIILTIYTCIEICLYTLNKMRHPENGPENIPGLQHSDLDHLAFFSKQDLSKLRHYNPQAID